MLRLFPRHYFIRHKLQCIRHLTHYEVLQVPRSATKAEIKKAYLERAKDCHPDLNPDDQLASIRFQEIQEAHDVLMSSKARAQYNAQLQRESYYGNQRTHAPEDGRPRQSNVRQQGMNNPYTRYHGKRNEDYHDKHRVNNDNYRYPGSQQTRSPFESNLDVGIERVAWNTSLLFLGFGIVAVVATVKLLASIKDESDEGRHGKVKIIKNETQAIKDGWNLRLSAMQDSLKPVRDTHRYVYSEDQDQFIRSDQKNAAKSLDSAFHSSVQSSLGDVPKPEKEPSPAPVEEVKKAPTQMDISLLRIEMNTKKDAYLAAKRSYTKKLKEYNEYTELQKLKKVKGYTEPSSENPSNDNQLEDTAKAEQSVTT